MWAANRRGSRSDKMRAAFHCDDRGDQFVSRAPGRAPRRPRCDVGSHPLEESEMAEVMQSHSLKCFAVVAGLALGTVGSQCTAAIDDTTVGDRSGALQEIVVTARRQNEYLEKVPVAVDALSTSALTEQHITNEQELQTAVPGLLTVAATSPKAGPTFIVNNEIRVA